jgi:hypothetical protein
MKAWIIDKICDLKVETHPLKLAELHKSGCEVIYSNSC